MADKDKLRGKEVGGAASFLRASQDFHTCRAGS